MDAVLVIVDLQRDFCAGGSLAVPDADAIVPIVNSLIQDFRRVILTQDWHPAGHVSFASSHPGRRTFDVIPLPSGEQALWPDHCIAGTAGAAFHPGVVIPGDTPVVRKGVRREIDSYSAFFENDGLTPVGLDRRLRDFDAGEVFLAGLATDYCILHTALDARRLGYRVTVLESACRGIDRDGTVADAWTRMAAAGVRRR